MQWAGEIKTINQFLYSRKRSYYRDTRLFKSINWWQSIILFFLGSFEKVYRIVLKIAQGHTSASMIKSFVIKFTFLDPASVVLATQKQNLQEALEIIDIVWKQIKLIKQNQDGDQSCHVYGHTQSWWDTHNRQK